MKQTFTTLYSLNTDGSLQEWTISVNKNTITKSYGKVDGKIQSTSDVIRNGKNVGKKNETTPEQQAVAEATSHWEKKLKSGYAKSKKAAEQGEVDKNFVAGGVDPMLAHKFRDHGDKILYPCFSQPKLDGIRCIAIIRKGKCSLWSRTRKPITGVPHIIDALEKAFPGTLILDGELYNHSYKNKFEEIVSFVRQETPKEGHTVVQYHIYDCIDATSLFSERCSFLKSLSLKNPLVHVETRLEKAEDDLMTTFDKDRKNGYEGTMARNGASLYEHKRSYSLQKIKEFDDAEFEILDVVPGRGRMSECAIFSCITKKGYMFKCKMEGSFDELKVILKHSDTVIGKKLTVRYQGLTNGNVPRFPVGVSVRDYE